MDSIGLATYSIQVREKHSKKIFFNFDKLPKEYPNLENFEDLKKNPYYDLMDILNEIFEVGDRHIHKKHEKIIKLLKWESEKSRVVYGLFGYGNYGSESEVVDTKVKDYSETLEQSKGVIKPFYFLFKLPKGSNLGMLIIERKSVSGLKVILNQWINQLLKNSNYKNFVVDINSMINEEMLNKYFNEGQLHSLRYIKHSIPKDYYDDIKTTEGKIETKISLNNPENIPSSIKNRLLGSVSKEKDNSYLKIKEVDYEDLKVELELNGKKRVFRSGHPEDASPYIDITD